MCDDLVTLQEVNHPTDDREITLCDIVGTMGKSSNRSPNKKVLKASPKPEHPTSVTVKQKKTATSNQMCRTFEEDDSDLSHTSIGLTDSHLEFEKKNTDISTALQCIATGHQDIPTGYHELVAALHSEHHRSLRILRQLQKGNPVMSVKKTEVRSKEIEPNTSATPLPSLFNSCIQHDTTSWGGHCSDGWPSGKNTLWLRKSLATLP